MAKLYYIEHRYAYGWDDAGWKDEDSTTSKTTTFTNKRKAQSELRDFLRERKGEHAPEDYRVAVYVAPKPFKFKPRKTDGAFTNGQRAERGEAMFRVHPDNDGINIRVDDTQTGARDALADFFHFCDRQAIDVSTLLADAQRTWQAER